MIGAPATCGELVQGSLDGIPCLVSCPIDVWAWADIALREQPGWTMPADTPKTAQAIAAGLVVLGRAQQGGELRLQSPIPRGRGYGSSTADISAALFALGEATAQPLSPEQVAGLAVGIEPSDSVMFPGLTLMDHRRASFHQPLGPAPDLAILVLDPGGAVDTIAFNRRDMSAVLRRLAADHRQAFDMLQSGLRQGDPAAVGAAATLSARLHQRILANPLLDVALACAEAVGALGVCRAHSGTILGILLDPTTCDALSAAAYVRGRLDSSIEVAVHRLVDGGAYANTTTSPRSIR